MSVTGPLGPRLLLLPGSLRVAVLKPEDIVFAVDLEGFDGANDPVFGEATI